MGVNVVTQNKYMYMIHDIMHDVPCARAAYIRNNLIALSTCSHLHTGSRLRICSHLHICSNLHAQRHYDKSTRSYLIASHPGA